MTVQITLLIICLVFSAFFSSSEISYSSVNILRLKKEAEQGVQSAKRALKIAENFNEMMYMVLFGNNFVNIGATSLAALIGMKYLVNNSTTPNEAATISSIAIFLVLLTVGEILPKTLSLKFSYPLAKAYGIPINIIYKITRPIVFSVNKFVSSISFLWKKKENEQSVTDDELIEMVDTIEEEGFINEKQGNLIRSAIDFCDTAVYEIMTPRVEVFAFDIDDSIEDLIKNTDTYLYSRIPIYEDNIDNIIGVLKTKTLLKKLVNNEKIDMRALLQKPIYVHKSRQISSVLKEFKGTHNHLAIIKDEFGGTMGIVTMEDIVEELVGDIWDETDDIREDYLEISEGVFTVNGLMNLYDFFELMEIDEEIESEYTTVGGWCIEMLERFARVGDTFEYQNLSIKVLEVDEFTVEQVEVVVKKDKEE